MQEAGVARNATKNEPNWLGTQYNNNNYYKFNMLWHYAKAFIKIIKLLQQSYEKGITTNTILLIRQLKPG